VSNTVVNLRAKYTGESVFLPPGGIDFTSMLNPGETLVSVKSVSASVYSGVDANPAALVAAVPSISGNKVLQLFTGGVAGTIYNISALVNTSLGQVLEIDGYLVVLSDNAAPTAGLVLGSQSGQAIESQGGQYIDLQESPL